MTRFFFNFCFKISTLHTFPRGIQRRARGSGGVRSWPWRGRSVRVSVCLCSGGQCWALPARLPGHSGVRSQPQGRAGQQQVLTGSQQCVSADAPCSASRMFLGALGRA